MSSRGWRQATKLRGVLQSFSFKHLQKLSREYNSCQTPISTFPSNTINPKSLESTSLFHLRLYCLKNPACRGYSRMDGQADLTAKPERTASQSRTSAPKVRLSCEACRQRKVKCDKLSPCTSCVRLGFVCVPVERARLPRGRTRKPPERAANTDKELADRVAKLEQLLRQVASERDGASTTTGLSIEPSTAGDPSSSKPSVSLEHGSEPSIPHQPSQPPHTAEFTMNLPHRPRQSTAYMASSFWEDIMQQVSTRSYALKWCEKLFNPSPNH